MGTGGIGFTIGSSKTTHDRARPGQRRVRVPAPSAPLPVIQYYRGQTGSYQRFGCDCEPDIRITGDSVVVAPGHDRRTVTKNLSRRKAG